MRYDRCTCEAGPGEPSFISARCKDRIMADARTGMHSRVRQIWLLLGVIIFTAALYATGSAIDGLAGDILRYSALTFGVFAGLIAIYGFEGIEKLL